MKKNTNLASNNKTGPGASVTSRRLSFVQPQTSQASSNSTRANSGNRQEKLNEERQQNNNSTALKNGQKSSMSNA